MTHTIVYTTTCHLCQNYREFLQFIPSGHELHIKRDTKDSEAMSAFPKRAAISERIIHFHVPGMCIWHCSQIFWSAQFLACQCILTVEAPSFHQKASLSEKDQQWTARKCLESYFCPEEKAHSGFGPWLPFTFVQNDSEQIKEILQGWESEILSARLSVTFSALERMQRMKKGSALPRVSSNLLSEVWNEIGRNIYFVFRYPHFELRLAAVQLLPQQSGSFRCGRYTTLFHPTRSFSRIAQWGLHMMLQ